MSIRTRLFLAFFLLVGLGFAVLIHWILDDLQPRYLETMEESMVDTATLLSSLLSTSLRDDALRCEGLRAAFDDARRRRFSARIYEVTKTRLDIRVYVTDDRGTVVFDSDDGRDEGCDYSRWNDVQRTLDGRYGARTTRDVPDDPRSAHLYVASPVERDGRRLGVVTVSKPAGSVRGFIELARRKILLAGAAAAFGVVLLGTFVSTKIAGPIRKLTECARAVRDGRRTCMPKLGRSEIGTLGLAFDEMRRALEGKEYVEDYIAALTHELKSPLAAIQGAAELLEDGAMPPVDRRRFLGHIRAESGRMQDVVGRLLELSSLEKRRGLREVERIDLAALAREVISAMEPVLSARRLRAHVVEESGASVLAERFLIRQSLANLLQNAVDFSPCGGTIDVRVAGRADRGQVSVRDRGPGVPDFAAGRVFDRFYSLSRPGGEKGSGLGLTFVREAVGLHGGEVRLENAEGGGARSTLLLPLGPLESALET